MHPPPGPPSLCLSQLLGFLSPHHSRQSYCPRATNLSPLTQDLAPFLKNLQHHPHTPSKPSLEGAGASSFTPQLVLLSQSDPTISGLARQMTRGGETTLTPLFQCSPLMSQSPASCGGILDAQRAGRNLNLTLPPPRGDAFVFTFAVEVAEIGTKCCTIIGDER